MDPPLRLREDKDQPFQRGPHLDLSAGDKKQVNSPEGQEVRWERSMAPGGGMGGALRARPYSPWPDSLPGTSGVTAALRA